MSDTIQQAFVTSGTGQDKAEVAHLYPTLHEQQGEWPKPKVAACGYQKWDPKPAGRDVPRCTDCTEILAAINN